MAIEGIKVKPLKVIPDERGRLMEILRCDDPVFRKFGQVYMTTVNPGVVKAWHYHKVQSDNIAVVSGMMKLGLYDMRPDSPTRGQTAEYFMGIHNPILVQIPPGVCHGFKGVGQDEAIVINCCTEPYNRQTPDEFRLEAHTDQIPYDWARKDY